MTEQYNLFYNFENTQLYWVQSAGVRNEQIFKTVKTQLKQPKHFIDVLYSKHKT